MHRRCQAPLHGGTCMQETDIPTVYQQHCSYSWGWMGCWDQQIPDPNSLQSADQDSETQDSSGLGPDPAVGMWGHQTPRAAATPTQGTGPMCTHGHTFALIPKTFLECVWPAWTAHCSSGCPKITAFGMSPYPLQSCNWQLSNPDFTPSVTQTRKRHEFHSHPEHLWTTLSASTTSSCRASAAQGLPVAPIIHCPGSPQHPPFPAAQIYHPR